MVVTAQEEEEEAAKGANLSDSVRLCEVGCQSRGEGRQGDSQVSDLGA